MPLRRASTIDSRDIKEALQLVQLLRSRAEVLAEPFLRNDLFNETPSEMLDRQGQQEAFVQMIGRLLDRGFFQDVVDLKALIEWYRSDGKSPFPFEEMREIAGKDPSGRRRVRYAPVPENVFAEIFGVGNDSLGIIGRNWPEAFPLSNVEGAAHEALFRSGIQAARELRQTEPRRRAARVREGIEVLASEVDAECARTQRSDDTRTRLAPQQASGEYPVQTPSISRRKPEPNDREAWKRWHRRDPQVAEHVNTPLTETDATTLFLIALSGRIPANSAKLEHWLGEIGLSSGTGSVKAKFVPKLRLWFLANHGIEPIQSRPKHGYWIADEHRELAMSVSAAFISKSLLNRAREAFEEESE